MTVRVFLVDDHEVVRRGLRDLIQAETGLIVVGEGATAQEALSRLPPADPDVVVLDVRLPDGDGVELCRELRSCCERLTALMLTSFDDDDALMNAVMAGAAGFVLKQLRGTDLVDAIRQVAAGGSLLGPAATERAFGRVTAILTSQERRILDLIAEGCTNGQIGRRMFLAEQTVRNHVSDLLLKLGIRGRSHDPLFGTLMVGLRDVGDVSSGPHRPTASAGR